METDTADAITELKRKGYSLFVFRGNVVFVVNVVDDKRKGRGMCQHIGYGRAICADKTKTQVEGRRKYKVSPSSANVGDRVPPTFATPFSALQDTVIVILVLF
jgi:hypothetical protein